MSRDVELTRRFRTEGMVQRANEFLGLQYFGKLAIQLHERNVNEQFLLITEISF